MMKTAKQDKSLGFTLIESLVVIFVIGIITFAIMTLMKSQMDGIRYMEDKISKVSFEKDLINIFSDYDSCLNSLESLHVPNANGHPTRVVIKDRNGDILFDQNNQEKNFYNGLKIKKIYLTNDSLDTSISNSGNVLINVDVERIGKGGGPVNFKTITLKQVISVIPNSRNIESCEGTSYHPEFFSFAPSPRNSWARPDAQYIGDFKICTLAGFNQRHSHKGLFHMFIEAGAVVPNTGGKRKWYAFNSSEEDTETLNVLCY